MSSRPSEATYGTAETSFVSIPGRCHDIHDAERAGTPRQLFDRQSSGAAVVRAARVHMVAPRVDTTIGASKPLDSGWLGNVMLHPSASSAFSSGGVCADRVNASSSHTQYRIASRHVT